MNKRNTGKLVSSKWITVRAPRHADFGGGIIDMDLPDTPTNRAAGGEILREWVQYFTEEAA